MIVLMSSMSTMIFISLILIFVTLTVMIMIPATIHQKSLLNLVMLVYFSAAEVLSATDHSVLLTRQIHSVSHEYADVCRVDGFQTDDLHDCDSRNKA
jgi:hypothetical protein